MNSEQTARNIANLPYLGEKNYIWLVCVYIKYIYIYNYIHITLHINTYYTYTYTHTLIHCKEMKLSSSHPGLTHALPPPLNEGAT